MTQGSTFKNLDGTFKSEHVSHFQTLGRPQDSSWSSTDLKSLAPSKFTRLKANFSPSAARNEIQAGIKSLNKMMPFLWTPFVKNEDKRAFDTAAVETLITYKMIAAEINVEVNFDHLSFRFNSEPLVQRWAKIGVKMPASRMTSVYVIAPEDEMKTTLDMVSVFAAQKEEPDSHDGLAFNESVAYDGLTDEQKKKLPGMEHPVGWFEIYQGVFFTTDRDMFERAKVVFGAKEMPAQQQLQHFDSRRTFEADEAESKQQAAEKERRFLKETDFSGGLSKPLPLPPRPKMFRRS